MKKVTKVLHEGQGTGLRVEEYRKEDDPAHLALVLAEELHMAMARQNDYDSFFASSMAERQKALTMQDLIFKLKERAKNPPAKISRMDPLNEHDLETCQSELKAYIERSADLQTKASGYATEAQEHRNNAQKLQMKLRKLSSSR